MPSIGPTLPPYLQKRKRAEDDSASSSSDDHSEPRSLPSPNEESKRRRVAGPAMPPAPLDERPTEPPGAEEDSDSSSDDGYGPALPTDPSVPTGVQEEEGGESGHVPPPVEEQQAKPAQRDSWMLAPPSQNDLTARMDPTKLRARKFNSGKGARGGGVGGSGEIDQIWTETPEQKAKRLKDEVMGVSRPKSGAEAARAASNKGDAETARRIKEHTEKQRGKTLVEQHQKTNKAEDDDPSRRKFDYEKDMGGAARLGSAQKREMINRAKDFGSKFSGGSYL